MNDRPLRIGIVAGEPSGDILGARLMRALRERFPGARFEGIGGSQMKAAGVSSLYPMERLSVMGITEILGRYVELARMRRQLVRHFLANPPDLFIGVDSPGFNLGLEERLRAAGIKTAHYVSPQVWAWRTWRIKKIQRAVDRMLVLLPFEPAFYATHGVEATFVGHPLADEIRDTTDMLEVRRQLKLPDDKRIVALMPGSRVSEVRALAGSFLDSARWLLDRHPDLHFVIPFINAPTRDVFEQTMTQREAWGMPITRVHGHSRDVIAAADVVLLASGTATLETLLAGKPMVVAYRVSAVTYRLIRWLSHISHYALPNLLAGKTLVPECLQEAAVPDIIGPAVERWLASPNDVETLRGEFRKIAVTLRAGGATRAADAVSELLVDRR
jgi:lipid-A-disaccharide synthase